MPRLITFIFLSTLALSLKADTTITYQGQLQQNGQPFTGTPGMEFRLFDSLTGTNQIGDPEFFTAVPVEDGLFQVELDFGAGAFDGGARWLEIEVAGDVLEPRQKITGSPWSHQALSVAAGSIGSDQITAGAVGSDQIATGAVTDAQVSGAAAIDPAKVDGTAATLDGGADFNGTVSAFNYEYNTPRTSHKTLPVSAFQPRDVGWRLSSPGGHYGYLSDGFSTYLAAPIQLAHGATIDRISCYLYDNHSTDDVLMRPRLTRSNLINGQDGNYLIVAEDDRQSVGASTDLRIVTMSDINETVSNSSDAYQLSVFWDPDSNSSTLRFYGCKVRYSADGPAH